MTKKIIILGANCFQRDLVLKAKALGYETHVFGSGTGYTEEQACKMTIAKEVADYYYPISILNQDAVLEVCQRINPDAILTIGCDIAVPTISYVAEKLGLIANSCHSALISTNKYEMKKAFISAGVPCANYILVDSVPEKLPFSFPVMVKTIDKSGKCGITKVNNVEELFPAIQYGLSESMKADKVLIEEYLQGKEYSAESITYNGIHHVLNFTEKFNLEPNFVEEMHLQVPYNRYVPFDNLLQEKLTEIIKKALTSLEIKFGASHTEFKITPEGEIKIIEIAGRMAAESMWDIVEISTFNDYLQMVIDIALGKEPTIEPSWGSRWGSTAVVKFILTEKDFEQLDYIKKYFPDDIYKIGYIEPFDNRKIIQNQQRYGYYVMKCYSRDDAIKLTKPQRI